MEAKRSTDVISEFFNSKLPWDMTFAYSHTLMVTIENRRLLETP
jgi:hypothetical protein